MVYCSTIIATVGRPTLARAVESVLEQDLRAGELEVVVVNDSGAALPAATWQKSNRVLTLDTQRRERSVARNAGAAIARGRYLHFLDDDDWLLPGGLQTLAELAEQSGRSWLYGSSQLVSRQGEPLIQLHHRFNGNVFLAAMAGEWIPLQASLIASSAFFSVGGFNPSLAGPEDIDLLRRIALVDDLAGTPALVACIVRGEDGTTTDHSRSVRGSRAAREHILDAPSSFQRMQAAVTTSSWAGRFVRIYLTSAVWNLQRRRFFSAANRSFLALAGTKASGPNALTPGFWGALARPYTSRTFLDGFGQPASRNRPGWFRHLRSKA